MLPEPVPAAEKKRRAQLMRALGARKKQEFCAGFAGKRVNVLVEGKIDKASGLQRGFSRNYLPVLLGGGGMLANREVDVRLKDFRNGWLNGSVEAAADGQVLTATLT